MTRILLLILNQLISLCRWIHGYIGLPTIFCKIMVANCGSKFLEVGNFYIFTVVYLIYFSVWIQVLRKLHFINPANPKNPNMNLDCMDYACKICLVTVLKPHYKINVIGIFPDKPWYNQNFTMVCQGLFLYSNMTNYLKLNNYYIFYST